jgi:hypothetical protein
LDDGQITGKTGLFAPQCHRIVRYLTKNTSSEGLARQLWLLPVVVSLHL